MYQSLNLLTSPPYSLTHHHLGIVTKSTNSRPAPLQGVLQVHPKSTYKPITSDLLPEIWKARTYGWRKMCGRHWQQVRSDCMNPEPHEWKVVKVAMEGKLIDEGDKWKIDEAVK